MQNQAYGYVKDGKVYRAAFLNFPERQIGEVREGEEESLQYYQGRFDQAYAQVEAVRRKIETNTNKGSHLMKVVHLEQTLHEFNAIGDFESLYVTLDKLHKELDAYIEANRHKNLQIKTALLEELRIVATSHEWKSATAAIKELQTKWLKTGAVGQAHKEAMEGEYKELTQSFYERRAAFYADLDKMMSEKEADFEAFMKKAEQLKTIKDQYELKKAIQLYREEWKGLGKIKPAKHNAFWEQFQAIVKSALAAAKKVDQEKRQTSSEDNKRAKKQLITRLEEANKALVPELDVKVINAEWKAIGPVDKRLRAELTEQYLFLIGMISEKQFLNTLLSKKSKKGSSREELAKLRLRLLRDLLTRDVNELKTFEENMGKFNMAKGLDDVLGKRLEQQKRKVIVKKAILDELKNLK